MRNFLLLLFPILSYSQTIEGTILDGELENTPLTFAYVSIDGTEITTLTDFNGSFKIDLEDGIYNITIQFLGYEPKKLKGIEIKSKETYRVSESLSPISL